MSHTSLTLPHSQQTPVSAVIAGSGIILSSRQLVQILWLMEAFIIDIVILTLLQIVYVTLAMTFWRRGFVKKHQYKDGEHCRRRGNETERFPHADRGFRCPT